MDGLLRELALVAQDPACAGSTDLPGRLTAVVDKLAARYAGVRSAPGAQRDGALDRGELLVDLHYRVPRSAAAAAEHLAQLLDEADVYCRAGTIC